MIQLYKPFMPDNLNELDYILHSGKLAYGDYTIAFEEKLRQYFGIDTLAVVSSFNMAISVLLTVLDIKSGDEVIASPMACLASTQPYAANGMKIVWADVDPMTGTLDPESVKSKITEKTKLIVHNHFCGYVGFIDEINRIAKENGIYVVDDGIECFGATYNDKLIGNCGTDFTVFSFNPVRLPNTIDGGVILFKDKSLYEKSLLIRDCGIDRRIFRDEIGEISDQCDISLIGHSATMSNVNGYIGFQQMSFLPELIEQQRKNARKWDEEFAQSVEYHSLEAVNGTPNYWIYGILCNNKRETIMKFRENGYYASGVHINNNIYSIFGKSESLPGVESFYQHFVALPCGWWVNK